MSQRLVATLQPTTTIDDLPDEILLQVLSYVDQEELQSSIPLVSRRWNALHNDPSFYRTLTFEDNNPPTSVAVKLINMAPWLTSLTMIDREDTDELLRHVGPNHPYLVKLLVMGCEGSPNKSVVSSKHLINVASNCTLLQNVSLKDTLCESSTFYEQIGQMLPNLRIIDLGYLIEYNTGTLTQIVKYFNNIEEIRMDMEQEDDDYYLQTHIPAKELLAFVKRCRESLRVFDFKWNVVWSDALLASVAQCLNLKELNLENAENITDNGLMSISHLTNVRVLTMLRADNITSQCWPILVHTPIMMKLQELVLHSSNIDVPVLSAIGLALRELVKCTIFAPNIHFEGNRTTTMPDLLDSSSCEPDQTPAQVETSSVLFPLLNKLELLFLYEDRQVLSVVGRMRNLVHYDMCIDGTKEEIMVIGLLPKLLELTLTGCKNNVTRDGWIQLFKSPNVTLLHRLTVQCCRYVDDTVASTIATNLRQLQFLCIYGCELTLEGEHRVKQLVLKRCKVCFNQPW